MAVVRPDVRHTDAIDGREEGRDDGQQREPCKARRDCVRVGEGSAVVHHGTEAPDLGLAGVGEDAERRCSFEIGYVEGNLRHVGHFGRREEIDSKGFHRVRRLERTQTLARISLGASRLSRETYLDMLALQGFTIRSSRFSPSARR